MFCVRVVLCCVLYPPLHRLRYVQGKVFCSSVIRCEGVLSVLTVC